MRLVTVNEPRKVLGEITGIRRADSLEVGFGREVDMSVEVDVDETGATLEEEDTEVDIQISIAHGYEAVKQGGYFG